MGFVSNWKIRKRLAQIEAMEASNDKKGLTDILHNEFDQVKSAALSSLARLGTDDHNPQMLECLEFMESTPRVEALESMILASPKPPLSLLDELITRKMCRSSAAEAKSALKKIAFEAEDVQQRSEALDIIVESADDAFKPKMIELLGHSDAELRRAALSYFSKRLYDNDKNVHLLKALDDPDEGNVILALNGLSFYHNAHMKNSSLEAISERTIERLESLVLRQPDHLNGGPFATICQMHERNIDRRAPGIFRAMILNSLKSFTTVPASRGRSELRADTTTQFRTFRGLFNDHDPMVVRALYKAASSGAFVFDDRARKDLARRYALAAIGHDISDHVSLDFEKLYIYLCGRIALGQLVSESVAKKVKTKNEFDDLYEMGWEILIEDHPQFANIVDGTNSNNRQTIFMDIGKQNREKNRFYLEKKKFMEKFRDAIKTIIQNTDPELGPSQMLIPFQVYLADAPVQSRSAEVLWKSGETRLKAFYNTCYDTKLDKIKKSGKKTNAKSDVDAQNWFKSADARGPALRPDQIDMGNIPTINAKQWADTVLANPGNEIATRIMVSDIGNMSQSLVQLIFDQNNLENAEAIDLLTDYLGAACPGCGGGVTGDLCLMLSAMESAGGVSAQPQVLRLLEGHCPHCSETEALLIWKSGGSQ